MNKCVMAFLAFVVSGTLSGAQVRIKDVATIRGARPNQLVGFGLVVGLSSTGDSSKSVPTQKAYASMLHALGLNVPDEVSSTQNVAAVMVTADLAAFSRIGDRFDVKVSTVGDAKSLSGGTLAMTPLKGADGLIYGMVQGAVIAAEGSSIKTVGMIPQGGTIEKDFVPAIGADGTVMLSLKNADFTNSVRVADQINSFFRGFFAESVDGGGIKVTVPDFYGGRPVEFLSELEGLRIDVDLKAKVVINQRTGTIVIGNDVRISPVSVAHGALTIKVDDKKKSPDGGGGSVAGIDGSTVGDLVKGLNSMGVKPQDLVSIFQAVAAAGALHGDLQIL